MENTQKREQESTGKVLRWPCGTGMQKEEREGRRTGERGFQHVVWRSPSQSFRTETAHWRSLLGRNPLGAHPSIVLRNWLELPEESGSSLQFNAAFHPEVFAAKVRQLTALLVADAPLE